MGRQHRHREADGDRFQGDAHDVELLHVVRGQPGDTNAMVGLADDEALALKHPQGFPKRCSPYAEALGQRRLGGDRALVDLAVEDRRAQFGVDGDEALAAVLSR